MNGRLCTLLTIIAIINFTHPAGIFAQVSGNDEIDSYARYIPSRSEKAQPGKVQIIESEFDYKHKVKLFGELPIDFSIHPQYIGIRNDTPVKFPSYLTGFGAGVETTIPFFNLHNTYFHVGAFPSFFGNQWDFDPSNFRIPSRSYFIYQPKENLSFIAGVAVFPKYQNSVLPVIGVIYKPNDKLTFDITPDRPTISYAFTKKLALFIEGGDSFDEFVVARTGTKRSILRYNEAHFGGGIKFKINQHVEASFSGGEAFMGSLEYRNEEGKITMEKGPYAEIRILLTI